MGKFTNQYRLVKILKHIKYLIAKINRTQTPKANKRNKPMFETHKTQNSNNISQTQENKTKNMKYRLKIEKPIPFLGDLKLKICKNGDSSRVTR